MPRPRFARLEPERQSQILDAAAREFAQHGFEAASYSRLIERLGLSKGAMYYYFDDKEDLYAAVLERAFDGFMGEAIAGDLPSDAAGYWAGATELYRRWIAALRSDPVVAGLLRSLVQLCSSGGGGAVCAKLRASWREQLRLLLAVGRSLGAVRADLPEELLVLVVLGMTEAMDTWLSESLDTGPRHDARAAKMLAALIRTVCEPREGDRP